MKIAIGPVNEAPKFISTTNAAKTLWVTENSTADDQPLRTTRAAGNDLANNAYAAEDEDSEETSVTYTLDGADKDLFELSTSGNLTFPDDIVTGDPSDDNVANYEKKSSYSITIVVTSGSTDDRTLRTRLDVTVNVVDAEDTGTVTLSQLEPQEGQTVIATLSDPDGGVRVSKWEWFLVLASSGTTCATTAPLTPGADTKIDEATSAAYTPKSTDVATGSTGNCLVARATYKDNIPGDAVPADTNDNDGDNDSEDLNDDGVWASGIATKAVQASKPDNTAPKFPDQDAASTGDQSDETSRSVKENADVGTGVGNAVTAVDDNQDLMLYTLSGPDSGSFTIDRASAQIKTAEKLDYETKDTYTVVVTATDPSGAQDSILVTISVTDVDDSAVISLNQAPEFADDSAERSVDENSEVGTSVGDPVTATDANAGDTLTYALSGDDAAHFAIDDMGQITVAEGAMLDYEAEQNTYAVTVTATDPQWTKATP